MRGTSTCHSAQVHRTFGRMNGTVLAATILAILLGACQPPKRVPLDPIPMRDAIRTVNENTAKVTGTLRSSGHVDGRFTLADGRSTGYHLDGVLFYLAPSYVRFDLKSFGDRKFLFGSNEDYYWYYDKEADEYNCGQHGSYQDLPSEIPIPPEQIVDALGLTMIPSQVSPGDPVHPVQRIVADYQQILFLERDERGHVTLQKEYWLDRYWPRLIRRVVFRDPDGVVEMESELADYKPLAPDGPMLAHLMTATWPKTDASMRFRVNRWRLEPSVGPRSAQFTAPLQCAR
jgi:hypothetical protein